jgi:UMP-CMP kinase
MAPNIVEKIADALHIPGVDKHEDKAAATAGGETKKKPIFEKEKVTVIFVLGGPGAGVSLLSNPTHSTSTQAHHL